MRADRSIRLTGRCPSALFVVCCVFSLCLQVTGQSGEDSIGLEQFRGKKVAEVKVIQTYPTDSEKIISDDQVRQVFLHNTSTLSHDLSARFLTNPETAKFAVEDYFANGGFLQSSVLVTGALLESGKVTLTVKVNVGRRSQVTGVVFTGDFTLPESELRKELTECIGPVKKWFDKRHYEYCLMGRVRELFFAEGYFKSRIEDLRMLSYPEGLVEIKVTQGPLYFLRRFEVQGAAYFGNENVRKLLGVTEGLPPNGKKIRYTMEKELEGVYKNLGFIEYDFDIDPSFVDPENEGDPGFVDFRVTIDEGSRYRLAGISFVLADSRTALMLRSLIDIRDGEYFSRKLLREGIEKINALGEFWEIDLDQDSEFRLNREKRELFIKIKIARRDD
ncbi:MAG: hypothetical protein IPM63_08520 [Acidobacteriota bacterium]|nr:MAG: hypothetical protein IPM63_08520 [Acidobacteriota bacterium]